MEKQELFPGDLVVTATDGLWDNLFEDFVAELAAEESDLDGLARNLARQARLIGDNTKAKTSWFVEGLGGKLDDITVVTARVFSD